MNRRRKRASPKQTAPRRTKAGPPRPARRGRPPKFGRPSQVVALTLPDEVLDTLRTLHRDLGWAIVQLVEQTLGDGSHRQLPGRPAALAELAHLPGRRSLIVVQPEVFTQLRGVATIPLTDGRAFLAFDHSGGLAELEVALLDRLEATPVKGLERTRLLLARDIVRAWRHDARLVFRAKSIIVGEGLVGVERRPLSSLKKID
jgi:hypothetical protein